MHSNPRIAAQLAALNNPSLPGIDLSLERMRALMTALGNPEKNLPPVIHLAGTNGKGSTLAFLRAIYEAAGYRVHAYTSPHLVRFNERIVIGGSEISDEYLAQLLEQVQTYAAEIPVTFFEATTAAAFLAFAEHQADVVLLETGMGGRLDATNLVERPIATIITPIGYDHMEFLGDTLGQIAGEKAGIMKRGVPCFVGAQQPEAREVLKRTARRVDCPLYLHGREWSVDVTQEGFTLHVGKEALNLPAPSLPGVHQYHNAALAATVAQALPLPKVSAEHIAKGIATAHWPARLQRLTHGALVEAWGPRGEVYLDGGHNAHAAAQLAAWMASRGEPITLILGMMARKDASAFLSPLVPHITRVITVPVSGGECYAPGALAVRAREAGVAVAEAAAELTSAAEMLAPAPNGTLLIAGSLFLAGDVLKNHG